VIVLSAMATGPVESTCPDFPSLKVTLRRLTSMELKEARYAANAVVRRLAEDIEAVTPYGLSGPDFNGQKLNTADPNQMLRVGMLIETVETALRALISWEGVSLERGGPVAPIAREVLAAILKDDRVDRWLRREMGRAAELLAEEKNVSGPSPSGGAGAAKTASIPNTAADAKRRASRAPAAARAKPASSAPRSKPAH
jgi:hypothetical protein